MAVEITAKKVQDQLRATFYPALGMLGIMVLIFIACTRFMAKTFGAGHFLAIVFYVMLALLLLFLAMLIGRIVLIEKHPALQPFGSTEKLAERINTGLHNPRYAAYSADGNSLVTLITDDFIVSGSDFVGLLELKNLKNCRRPSCRKPLRVHAAARKPCRRTVTASLHRHPAPFRMRSMIISSSRIPTAR